MDKSAGFNARETHAFALDKLYRMYVVDGQLYCIRVGGQGGVGRGVAAGLRAQLGFVGALLGGMLTSASAEGAATAAEALDRRDPRVLLKSKEGSFILLRETLVDARLEPSAAYQAHGDQHGRLLVTTQDGKKTTFQFETIEDMHRAVQSLPEALGDRLNVNVEWSERSKEYTRKRG